jgi:sugar phosphate isomerase/epimerase
MAALDRRRFLTTNASAALLGGPLLQHAATQPAAAMEPIVRNGKSQFKFSLAAYSYREWLTGKKGNLTLDDFIDDCAKFGLEGTELTSYYFPKEITNEYLLSLKAHCFRLGLDVSGTAIRDDLCLPPGPARDKEIAHVKQWIEYSAVFGAPVIRIFSGHAQPGQTVAEAQKLAIAGMEECCDHAAKYGVVLALENHGGLTETVDGMLELVKGVKSPWFAVNLDSGNFWSADPYADLARIAPYAMNVQIKTSIHRGDRKTTPKEPSDFKALAKIMRDVGYRGYIVLEYEDGEDPRSVCPRFLDELRAAFA